MTARTRLALSALALPLLAACLALLAQWGWSMASEARAEAQLKAQQDAQQINAATLTKVATREYVLEVIGLAACRTFLAIGDNPSAGL